MQGGYGILLVAILVLVSGFIAYLGDVLGRRMGRRRVTLFGMRPRYTAIFISVVAGMLITLVTLLAAATVSKDVRDGLLKAGVMRTKITELEAAVRHSETRLSNAKSQTTRAESEWNRARKTLSEARLQTADAVAQLKQVSTKLDTVELERARVAKRLSDSQARLKRIQAQYASASADLQKKKLSLKDLDTQLDRSEQKNYDMGREQLALEKKLADLAQNRSTLEKDIITLQERSRSLSDTSIALSNQVAKLQRFINSARPALTQEPLFEVGQEIGRSVIDTSLPVGDIQKQLEQFVRGVEVSVRAAGAGEDETGRAVILAKMIPPEGENSQPKYIEDAQVLELLAIDLHKQNGTSVVRCFSWLNVPRNQPVPIDLGFVPNKLLFNKGSELAKITLDPGQTEARLFVQIVIWMREDVAAKAHQESILPDFSSPSEKSLLFGTPQYSVGRISPERLFALLKEIKRHKTPVQIVARAAKDTWTTGPLDVELAVVENSKQKPRNVGLLQMWGTY